MDFLQDKFGDLVNKSKKYKEHKSKLKVFETILIISNYIFQAQYNESSGMTQNLHVLKLYC